MKIKFSNDYATFRAKITRRFCGNALLSILIVIVLYVLLWRQRGGNLIAYFLMHFFGVDRETANMIYFYYFRSYREVFFAAAITFVFAFLLLRLFRWMTKYFKEIDQGIDALQVDDSKAIRLSPEMLPFESKLNAVKQTLERQKAETALAEQRKNELVMYLAHDIRTPLTSVIGYLSLLHEDPDMPAPQRVKHVRITLEKAYRLEKMINEFFEITRFNLTHQVLEPGRVDMVRMLEQMAYEFKPLLSPRHLDIALDLPEQCIWYVDVEKMERVFDNLLRNAINYAFDDSTIQISLRVVDQKLILKFENAGNTIPPEKLSRLFEQFFRLDESRSTAKGGAGLGLAIAKTIVEWHHGTITVESHDERIIFTVTLPQLS